MKEGGLMKGFSDGLRTYGVFLSEGNETWRLGWFVREEDKGELSIDYYPVKWVNFD